jgi:HEAT repeats
MKKGTPNMKRISHTYETPLKSSSTRIIGFLFLVVLTFVLWQAHLVTGWQFLGLLAYLSAVLDIALLMWLFVHITLRSHASASSQKVLMALVYSLEQDPDPRVRSKAVVGLVQLDKELSYGHQEHHKLDDILIHALQDPDPGVRSKAAVGLAELKLEQEKPTYHHVHNKLDNMLFEEHQ